MFSYLYLIQGIISGIIGTMPYIYPQLPDYNTMALFGANLIPFSFKFILGIYILIKLLSFKNTVLSAMENAKRGWFSALLLEESHLYLPASLLTKSIRTSLQFFLFLRKLEWQFLILLLMLQWSNR